MAEAGHVSSVARGGVFGKEEQGWFARGTAPAVVALGSNLGDSRRLLELAVREMRLSGLQIERASRLYWSRPWGVLDQPPFLNAAVTVRGRWRPLQLLDLLQSVEARFWRRRERRWGPRTLDLDLLLCGSVHVTMQRLTLPHPWIGRRDFVLAPLIDLDVAPDPAVAPMGWRALLAAIPAQERTIYQSEPWKVMR